jgi:hypothetical protein
MTGPTRDAVWPDAVCLGPGLLGPEVLGRRLFGSPAPTPRWRRASTPRTDRPPTHPNP